MQSYVYFVKPFHNWFLFSFWWCCCGWVAMPCQTSQCPAPSSDAGVWLTRRAVWIFFFFLFPGSAAFIQRPGGERLVLIQLSFPEWHEFEQLEMTEVPSKTVPAPPGAWLHGWGSCSRFKGCPSYEELRGQSGEREGEGKFTLLYRTVVLLH